MRSTSKVLLRLSAGLAMLCALPALPAQPAEEAPQEFHFRYSEDRCESPDGRRGACVNIRGCDYLLGVLRNLRGDPASVQLLRNSVCGWDGLDPVVCCPDDSLRATRPPETPPEAAYRLPSEDDGCGLNNGTFSKRVVGGAPAELGSWPWISLLGYRSKRTPGRTLWQCGATLITARHVLTAAHCVHGHEDDLYLVRVGELDLERDDEGATPQDVPVEAQLKHPEYNPSKYTNDIAVIKMQQDVIFTPLIVPACLPRSPDLLANNFERTLPFIAGWGATSFQGPSAGRLQELQIPVVPNEQCREAYSRFKAQVIDERVLCAGYARGGKDACQGDSGGPLTYPRIPPGRDLIHFYLIGVVSYGFKCAEPGFPGVYSRVTEFLPWIESQLNV